MNRRNFLTLGGKAGLIVGSGAMIIPSASLMALPRREQILLGLDEVVYLDHHNHMFYRAWGEIKQSDLGRLPALKYIKPVAIQHLKQESFNHMYDTVWGCPSTEYLIKHNSIRFYYE